MLWILSWTKSGTCTLQACLRQTSHLGPSSLPEIIEGQLSLKILFYLAILTPMKLTFTYKIFIKPLLVFLYLLWHYKWIVNQRRREHFAILLSLINSTFIGPWFISEISYGVLCIFVNDLSKEICMCHNSIINTRMSSQIWPACNFKLIFYWNPFFRICI